jgi:hypothetical protein
MADNPTWPWPPELDALIAAPKHHKLILENDRMRLIDTIIPVGETVPVHTHQWPGVYYTIQFSHFVRRDGEGTLLFDSRTITGDRPGTAFLENLPPHSVENVGDVDIHLISVELKG